jgi:hypothetical protein
MFRISYKGLMRSDPTHADFAHAAVLSVSYTRMMYACAAAVDGSKFSA